MPQGTARLAGRLPRSQVFALQHDTGPLVDPYSVAGLPEALDDWFGTVNPQGRIVVPNREANQLNQLYDDWGTNGKESSELTPLGQILSQNQDFEIVQFNRDNPVRGAVSDLATLRGTQQVTKKVPENPIQEIRIGDQSYNPDFFEKTYRTLQTPKDQEFYSSPNLRGYTKGGGVGILRNLNEVGWSYDSPEEIKQSWFRKYTPEQEASILASTPVDRELRGVARGFKEMLASPDGAGVYTNSPIGGIEGKRAKLYRTMGFVDDPFESQLLDNRNPVNTDQQRLLAVADRIYLPNEYREIYEASRKKRNLPVYELPTSVRVNGMNLDQYLATRKQRPLIDLYGDDNF